MEENKEGEKERGGNKADLKTLKNGFSTFRDEIFRYNINMN